MDAETQGGKRSMVADQSHGEMRSGSEQIPSPGGRGIEEDDEDAQPPEVRFAAVMVAVRERWPQLSGEERAFLNYCLRRVRDQVRGT
jgi:hypothetical protein